MKLVKPTSILLLFCLYVFQGYAQCFPPNPVTGYVGCDSVFFTWAPVTGATQYIYMVTTSPTPTGAPNNTVANFASKGGLSPSTTYYIHIQAFCSSGPSAFGSISFTTTATCPCNAPSGISATPASASASFTWNTVPAASGYEYVVDQSAGNPAGSGTATATTSGSKTGLTAATNYYVHVRTKCGTSTFSAWAAAVPFTTTGSTPCAVPTAINITGVTGTTATITWTAVTGASYEYVVDQSAADPAGAGTAASAAIASVTGLAPAKQYYAHVRAKCSGSNYSNWSAAQAFTTSATGIRPLSYDGFSMAAYPNPASTAITIDINGTIDAGMQLRITGIDGKIVKTIAQPRTHMVIDVHELSSGLYFIEYIDIAHRGVIKLNKQ